MRGCPSTEMPCSGNMERGAEGVRISKSPASVISSTPVMSGRSGFRALFLDSSRFRSPRRKTRYSSIHSWTSLRKTPSAIKPSMSLVRQLSISGTSDTKWKLWDGIAQSNRNALLSPERSSAIESKSRKSVALTSRFVRRIGYISPIKDCVSLVIESSSKDPVFDDCSP